MKIIAWNCVFVVIIATQADKLFEKVANYGDCYPAGKVMDFKVWNGSIFWALRRSETDTNKITLAVSSIHPSLSEPQCRPYPNIDLQKVDNCTAFQTVSYIEIDPIGRMWVLDEGLGACPAKLVILNLTDNGHELNRYSFPSDEEFFDSRFVLDHRNGGYAYISWALDGGDPAIKVYSLSSNKSWMIHLPYPDPYLWTPRASLALFAADDEDRFLYQARASPNQSRPGFSNFQRIPVECLRNDDGTPCKLEQEEFPLRVRDMVMSADGVMYMGLDHSLGTNHGEPSFTTRLGGGVDKMFQSIDDVDFITIDDSENLWAMSFDGKLYKSAIGSADYQHHSKHSRNSSTDDNTTQISGVVPTTQTKADTAVPTPPQLTITPVIEPLHIIVYQPTKETCTTCHSSRRYVPLIPWLLQSLYGIFSFIRNNIIFW